MNLQKVIVYWYEQSVSLMLDADDTDTEAIINELKKFYGEWNIDSAPWDSLTVDRRSKEERDKASLIITFIGRQLGLRWAS